MQGGAWVNVHLQPPVRGVSPTYNCGTRGSECLKVMGRAEESLLLRFPVQCSSPTQLTSKYSCSFSLPQATRRGVAQGMVEMGGQVASWGGKGSW